MLDYLVEGGSITEQTRTNLKYTVDCPVGDDLRLAQLLIMFAGPEWATSFLSSLPIDDTMSADLCAVGFSAVWYG